MGKRLSHDPNQLQDIKKLKLSELPDKYLINLERNFLIQHKELQRLQIINKFLNSERNSTIQYENKNNNAGNTDKYVSS